MEFDEDDIEKYSAGLKKDGLKTLEKFKTYIADGSIDEKVLKDDYGFKKFDQRCY